MHKLRVQALRGCLSLRILNQAVGSLLSKVDTLVRVGSWALHSHWEREMRDRRSLSRMEIIGLELRLGSAWFSVHAQSPAQCYAQLSPSTRIRLFSSI